MSYPNYPSYPNQGPGYPPSYPPQQNTQSQHYPGYPPQPGFASSALPSYPNPGYPGTSASSAYQPNPQPTPYPLNPTYPSTNPGYPAANPGYPPANPGYPPANPGYPPANPGYPPANPGYPPANPSPSTLPSYPTATPGYLPTTTPTYPGATAGYPPVNPGYPSASTGYAHNPSTFPGAIQGPAFPGQSHIGHYATMEQKIPTVHPASPFDPRVDAEHVHKAMKGLGTDEKALINILCHRTSIQRTQIATAYKSSFGKDLVSKLKSELSGNMEKVMVALATPMAEYLAKEMHDAVDGAGTNEGTLIEILCSRSNHEIHEINAAYQRLYNHSLEKDVAGDTSGDFKRILVALMQGNRDDNPVVNVTQARDDAQRLYHAGEGKLGTDESTFIAILASRSLPHIRQVMAEYEHLKGHSLERVVKSEFSGYVEKAMLTILQCAQSQPAYFAHRLRNALAGAGTNDRTLIRVLVSRCDIDLGSIKTAYEKAYGKSLQADISGDTSGDYKKALLALVG